MHNEFKSIALLLDESQQASGLTNHAAALTKERRAHVIGIYLLFRASGALTGFARGEGAMREAIAHLRKENEHSALAASRHFALMASKYQITVELRMLWLDASGGVPLHSLHCDVLIAEHPTSEFLPPDAYLAYHGIVADVLDVGFGDRPVEETIVSTACSASAELLVIGAYSHPRFSEKLFGGMS